MGCGKSLIVKWQGHLFYIWDLTPRGNKFQQARQKTLYTVKAFRVSGLFCHLPAGQSVISASNVFTDSHVISGPALEVVAELGHRAFLPCSLSSPQVLSIFFFKFENSFPSHGFQSNSSSPLQRLSKNESGNLHTKYFQISQLYH